jgi:hypothetical protein
MVIEPFGLPAPGIAGRFLGLGGDGSFCSITGLVSYPKLPVYQASKFVSTAPGQSAVMPKFSR